MLPSKTKISKNVSLSRLCTFGVGGTADYFATFNTQKELIAIYDYFSKKEVPMFLIGGGSNLLISDIGFRGAIIKSACNQIIQNENCWTVGSGVPLSLFARKVSEAGFLGLSGLCGIPGSVGGGIFGNAGAYGFTVCDQISSILVYDLKGRKYKTLKKEELNATYRKTSLSEVIILEASFGLKRGDPSLIKKEILEFSQKRSQNQPSGLSAGSFFKNPNSKTSAGRLIEECGLKGKVVGGAVVSEKHANFIINTGKACASDIFNLALLVQEEVYKKTGFRLEREVKLLGDFI